MAVTLALGRVLLALIAGGAIAYAVGSGAVLAFAAGGAPQYLAVLPQRILGQLDVFAFLAMPLFILTGELMNRGGVTRALVDLAMALVGRLKGGLGQSTSSPRCSSPASAVRPWRTRRRCRTRWCRRCGSGDIRSTTPRR